MDKSDYDNSEEKNTISDDRTHQADVWEEEIDLREVGRGILKKWYVWVIVPFVITIFTGISFMIQPDKYQISGTFIINTNQTQLNEVDVGFPPEDVIEEQFRGTSEFQPILQKYGLLEEVENPEQYVLSFTEGLTIETTTNGSDSDQLRFDVHMETTAPDTIASILNTRMETFRRNQITELQDRLEERQQSLEERENYFENQWREWRTQWTTLQSDSLPSLLNPQYKNARNRYENAIENLDSTREKLAELKSQQESIETMIESEPVTFSYQSPYLPFLGEEDPATGKGTSSDAVAAEAINEAYQSLRKRRVSTNVSLSKVQKRIENYQEAKKKNREQFLDIRQKLPTLERRISELKNRRSFLEQNLEQIRSSLNTIDSLLSSMPRLIDLYPAEASGDLITSNGRRNTLLAGVVSFLLLFFGVAFWEIL